jgi:hypothetical protein
MKNYKLTNQDISANFRDIKLNLMLNDFRGAMAYWLASQEINTSIEIGIDKPLNAFTKYMQQKYFKTESSVMDFTYEQLKNIISEDVLIAIPELMELNEIKGKSFYDLGALYRNVFYTILREQITQPL